MLMIMIIWCGPDLGYFINNYNYSHQSQPSTVRLQPNNQLPNTVTTWNDCNTSTNNYTKVKVTQPIIRIRRKTDSPDSFAKPICKTDS